MDCLHLPSRYSCLSWGIQFKHQTDFPVAVTQFRHPTWLLAPCKAAAVPSIPDLVPRQPILAAPVKGVQFQSVPPATPACCPVTTHPELGTILPTAFRTHSRTTPTAQSTGSQ